MDLLNHAYIIGICFITVLIMLFAGE